MILRAANSNSAYRLLEDDSVSLNKDTLEIIQSIDKTWKEAAEANLPQQASEILETKTRLESARQIAKDYLKDARTNLGIVGSSFNNRPLDISPPVFSGEDKDELDFFSFKSRFEAYTSSKLITQDK